jgi:hypothetical protein
MIRAIALIQIVRGEVSIGLGQTFIQGGFRGDVWVEAYRTMENADLTRILRRLLDNTVVAPGIFSAETWLLASQMPNIANNNGVRLFESQRDRQAEFRNQVAQVNDVTTREVYRQMVERCGKLNWVATNPDSDNATKFQIWVQNNANSSENLDMNCWEGVLYCAFQAGAISLAKCRALYNQYNPQDRYENTRNLFGNDRAFAGAVKERGDILTWGMDRNTINHVGIYLGTMNENGAVDDYVGHLLSFNPRSTGIVHQVGRVHIEKVAVITGNLPGYQCYITRPFWINGSPTNGYFQGL